MLPIGNYNISATYPGTSFVGSSTGKLNNNGTFIVNQDGTTTTLNANPTTWNYGQTIAFTATVGVVAPGVGNPPPAGNVAFFDDNPAVEIAAGTPGVPVMLGTQQVNSSSQATFSTSSLAVGAHDIYASYLGSTNYGSSQSNHLAQSVNLGTVTTLTSSANPVNNGTQVTFTVAVTAANGFNTPTGTITLTDMTFGTTLAANATLVNGKFSFTTTNPLTIGIHSIQAVFTPVAGSAFNASTSKVVAEVVNSLTTTTVATSANPVIVGQPLFITATVSPVAPGGGLPAGQVSFYDGTAFIGNATLNGSSPDQATLKVTTLTRGVHNLSAIYGGSSGYTTSTSNTVTQTVQYASTTTLVASPNPALYGNSVTFTATVAKATGTPTSAGVPTGTVSFYDGGTFLGTATLNTANKAPFAIAGLGVGLHAITAVYNANVSFGPSTSGIVNEVIQSRPPPRSPPCRPRCRTASR